MHCALLLDAPESRNRLSWSAKTAGQRARRFDSLLRSIAQQSESCAA